MREMEEEALPPCGCSDEYICPAHDKHAAYAYPDTDLPRPASQDDYDTYAPVYSDSYVPSSSSQPPHETYQHYEYYDDESEGNANQGVEAHQEYYQDENHYQHDPYQAYSSPYYPPPSPYHPIMMMPPPPVYPFPHAPPGYSLAILDPSTGLLYPTGPPAHLPPQYYHTTYECQPEQPDLNPHGFFGTASEPDDDEALVEDLYDEEDGEYEEESSCISQSARNSLGSFIDFAPEFNSDKFIVTGRPAPRESKFERMERYDKMRPKEFFKNFTQDRCGSQLQPEDFAFFMQKSANTRGRIDARLASAPYRRDPFPPPKRSIGYPQ